MNNTRVIIAVDIRRTSVHILLEKDIFTINILMIDTLVSGNIERCGSADTTYSAVIYQQRMGSNN